MPDDLDDDQPRPTGVRWRVFALACGASFLLYLHRYTWNIVGPKLQDDFRLSNTEAGFLFSLFYYTYACGQIPSGVVIDRFGPHRFLTVIIVAWSVALAAIGQAASTFLLLLGFWRLVFGSGAGRLLSRALEGHGAAGSRRPSAPCSRAGSPRRPAGAGGGRMAPIILGTILMGWCGLSWRMALGVLGGIGAAYGLACSGRPFRDTPAEHPACQSRGASS